MTLKTSSKSIFVLFFSFNFSIFFSKILKTSFSFSIKITCLASLDKHSSPNDPVPEYKSKIFDCSKLK